MIVVMQFVNKKAELNTGNFLAPAFYYEAAWLRRTLVLFNSFMSFQYRLLIVLADR